jgi:cytosolic carboxypeptidase protein 2/3
MTADFGAPFSNKYMPSHEGEADVGVKDLADMYIPVKTGTTVKHIKNPPYHLKESFDFEPLYPPQEFILEESLRREADRIAFQENLMNRVVYDSIDPSPYQQGEAPEGEITPFYVLMGPNDNTLLFESRFESGNLRRAIQVYEYEYDLILKPDYNTRGYT